VVENGKLLLLAGVARVQINILNFSDTVQDDGTFRLDAEHYQKHYLKNQNKLTCFGSQSLSEIIVNELDRSGLGKYNIEGKTSADWKLIDAIDIIVHIFHPEKRKFYDLEKMWCDPSEFSGVIT